MTPILAQTFTAAASQAIEQTIGWGGVAGIGGTLLALTLGYLRGVRYLAPLVAMVEWFRSNGARSLDLTGLGLSADEQERVRAAVQSWLWDSLRDAARQFAGAVGLSAAFDAQVQRITGALKVGTNADGKAAAPVTIEETTARLKRTTGVIAAFRPDGLPQLVLLAALCLGATGCVAPAVHDAIVEAQASAETLDRASVANPGYTEPSDPTATAASLAAYRRLWASHKAALAAAAEASK